MSIRSFLASIIGKSSQEAPASIAHTSGSSEVGSDATNNDAETKRAPSIETRSVESDHSVSSTNESIRLDPATGPSIDDLFGLLVTQDLCPAPLKGYSTAEGQWQGISSHLRRMYMGYLSSSEYTGNGSSDENSYLTLQSHPWVLYFGQQLAASFNRTGTNKRLVTLLFRMDGEHRSCAPLDPTQGLQSNHQTLDKKLMEANRGESDNREKAIGDLLRKIPFPSRATPPTVDVIALEDQTAAWCTASNSKMTLYYGVIQQSEASDYESASSVSTDGSWDGLEDDAREYIVHNSYPKGQAAIYRPSDCSPVDLAPTSRRNSCQDGW
ncbi:hypothetical protein FFLO_06859 [Filobasidium floriforme]|uniref:Uncharacterized protein n=1 Tax=Filobasidium floriforme TaxID=5210 RepID=A0A8K0NK70_9TREE|nr:uncharacterized protein HD553DRAFT_322732 [Filobasidium floriforme]KAG7527513.1 hypothetical protein FFLO_06859 [Filobasidium floriforme]KAH8087223.1 hypothetical protein HD553DRAFT_322732 [Filobasidium floriforme]